MKKKHNSLSLGGNISKNEYSNKERSKFYDKPDISPYSAISQQPKSLNGKGKGKGKGKNQNGRGFWADVIGGAAGGLGAIAGAIGGPIGSGALGAAAAYGGKKLAEQYGLGYQYKSPPNVGLWGTPNSFGAVSMNAPISL